MTVVAAKKSNTYCALCGKGTRSAHNISHSHRVTKRRQKPNLQMRRIKGQRVRVCAKCIKKLKKEK